MGAVPRVRDRVADRVGSCIRDRAASKTIADQIKAIPVPARTQLVNVVGGDQLKAVLVITLGLHSSLSSRRLKADKRDISVTFFEP